MNVKDTKAMDAKELRSKTPDQLRDELVALKKEAFNLRFQQATNQLLDPSTAPSTQAWQQAGTAALLWIALPLVIGLWRVARREVK